MGVRSESQYCEMLARAAHGWDDTLELRASLFVIPERPSGLIRDLWVVQRGAVKVYYVYIMASRLRGALYVGVTSDLVRRVYEHKEGLFSGHTAKYKIDRLVWCAPFANIDDAIAFEKRLKRWRRLWKFDLIEKENPNWDDLNLAGQ